MKMVEKQKQTILIVYLTEEGDPTEVWCENYSFDNGFVVFETTANILAIPIHRILKIKHSKEKKESEDD
jgi:hypothetical protein